MAFVQIAPVVDRSGTLDSGRRVWPGSGIRAITGRMDVVPFSGKANPFNDPALEVDYRLYTSSASSPTAGDPSTSIDWVVRTGGAFNGNAAGIWGRNDTFPLASWTIPTEESAPFWFRAVAIVNGAQTITFGVSVQVA